MAPPKDISFMFILGINILAFLSIKTISELFHILSEGCHLVVMHDSLDDRAAHLHIAFPCTERARHAKIQNFVRFISSLLRDYIINRFGLLNHLKQVNVNSTDFDIEKLSACLFAQDQCKHNGSKLKSCPDKITRELVERCAMDYLPLDLDCLDVGLPEDIQKQIHLAAGNFQKSHYGDDGKSTKTTDFDLLEDGEAVR